MRGGLRGVSLGLAALLTVVLVGDCPFSPALFFPPSFLDTTSPQNRSRSTSSQACRWWPFEASSLLPAAVMAPSALCGAFEACRVSDVLQGLLTSSAAQRMRCRNGRNRTNATIERVLSWLVSLSAQRATVVLGAGLRAVGGKGVGRWHLRAIRCSMRGKGPILSCSLCLRLPWLSIVKLMISLVMRASSSRVLSVGRIAR